MSSGLASPRLFSWLYGLSGIAVSVGVTFLLSAVYLLRFARRHLAVDLAATVGRPLLNSGLALALFLVLRQLVPLAEAAPWQRLAVHGAGLLTLYALVSLATSGRLIVQQVRYLLLAARS